MNEMKDRFPGLAIYIRSRGAVEFPAAVALPLVKLTSSTLKSEYIDEKELLEDNLMGVTYRAQRTSV